MRIWQYNGVAPWHEIIGWCRKTFTPDSFSYKMETIMFDTEQQYVMFILRWS